EARGNEEAVPSEASRAPWGGGDRTGDFAAPADQTLSVEPGDLAGRRRGAVGKGVEHPRDRFDAGRLLEPFHEGAREAAPRMDREPGVLDQDRPANPRVRAASLGLDDLSRIDRLDLGKIESQPLEPEAQPLGLLRFLDAPRDEDGNLHGRKLSAIGYPRSAGNLQFGFRF